MTNLIDAMIEIAYFDTRAARSDVPAQVKFDVGGHDARHCRRKGRIRRAA